jgi:DHA2 family multidrug resistance protein
MYRDRNFLTGNILIFLVGIVLFATLALLPPMPASNDRFFERRDFLVQAPIARPECVAQLAV